MNKMVIRDVSIKTFYEIKEEGLISERQAEVFEYILKNPNKTDREIVDGLCVSDSNYVRPRRKELFDLGLIIDCPKKICSISKKKVLCWKVFDINRENIIKIKTRKKKKCDCCNGKGWIYEN